MKNLIHAVVVAAALAAPVAVFAQNKAPLTRAQVRAELYELEKAGYNPSLGDAGNYPDDIQAAQARVDQQHTLVRAQDIDNSGVGNEAQGASASGSRAQVVRPASNEEMKSLYRGS